MCIYPPQSEQSAAEARLLMGVERQLVTPQSNRPTMGIVQDPLLGARLLTSRDTFLDRAAASQLAMCVAGFAGGLPTPAVLRPRVLWTGKQIVSLLLAPTPLDLEGTSTGHPDAEDEPREVQLRARAGPSGAVALSDATVCERHLSPTDTRVLVRRGELLAGMLCRRTLGAVPGSLPHLAVADYGHEAAVALLDGVQRVVNEWLQERGFSAGYSDLAGARGRGRTRAAVDAATRRIERLMREPGVRPAELEERINRELNATRDLADQNTMASLARGDSYAAMALAASKGTVLNITMIRNGVGQQNVEGRRIPWGYRGRALPHSVVGDLRPRSCGYVESSYVAGLRPDEMFFHAVGGREGLVDTAVKTAPIGYTQRRLGKAMEDLHVAYDGTVRNSQGDAVQLAYGEDGFDGTCFETQRIDLRAYAYAPPPSSSSSSAAAAPTQPATPTPSATPTQSATTPTQSATTVTPPSATLTWAPTPTPIPPGCRAAGPPAARRPTPGAEDGAPAAFARRYVWDADADRECAGVGAPGRAALDREARRLRDDVARWRELGPCLINDGPSAAVPVNVARLVASCRPAPPGASLVAPAEAALGLEALQRRLWAMLPTSCEAAAVSTFAVALRATLASKRAVREYRLAPAAWRALLDEVERRFARALVHPGENVGILAAQSIGEPATQMTLRTVRSPSPPLPRGCPCTHTYTLSRVVIPCALCAVLCAVRDGCAPLEAYAMRDVRCAVYMMHDA